MYYIQAFIPKSQGDHNVSAYLHMIGARNVYIENEGNAFYNEYNANVNDRENIYGIINYVNSVNGVIRVDGTYYQEFRLPSHLEIADEDGMLNPSDGVYSNEY